MRQCLRDAAARHSIVLDGETITARVEEHVNREYHAMNVPDDSRIVQLVMRAATKAGARGATRPTSACSSTT